MGNANVREDGAASPGRSNGPPRGSRRAISSDLMASNPPASPGRSRSPLLFPPQLPAAPLQRADSTGTAHRTSEGGGIPTVITWTYGGNEVAIEGSWDNWTSRKTLQRSGKDHSILLVLPSGIYHYKFIVDGQWRHLPDLPNVADEMQRTCNILDVHEFVPESLESIAEFEAPSSPESSYSQTLPPEEDFAKEPALVPPQLRVSVLRDENSDEAASSMPQHVVLNHLYIEKGKAPPQSVVALGLTHRFQSKYVTVVLYKPQKR